MQKIRDRLSRISIYLIAIFIILLILTPVVSHYRNVVEARIVLSEAKNVQLTMRLLTIEYNAHGQYIYDSTSVTGMSTATYDEVAYLAGAEGEITLIAWNSRQQKPEKFLYRNGDYMVIYLYESDRDQDTWEVYRLDQVLDLGKM